MCLAGCQKSAIDDAYDVFMNCVFFANNDKMNFRNSDFQWIWQSLEKWFSELFTAWNVFGVDNEIFFYFYRLDFVSPAIHRTGTKYLFVTSSFLYIIHNHQIYIEKVCFSFYR